MATLGRLQATVTADVAQFQGKMKEAEKAAEGFKDKASKSFESVGNKINAINPQLGSLVSNLGRMGPAAVVAVGAAFATLVINTAEAAKEIKNLSTLAGATPEEFQKWGAAAKTVGIQQDKLSDILKDFREKMGEAQIAGSGAFADMLKNIGAQTGLTMDSFKGLSGPQGLQLIVKRMQEAGYNTAQMSAVMESLGSDSTALIPLLQDNARGLNDIADKAQKAGAIMSNDTVDGAAKLKGEIEDLQTELNGIGNEIMTFVIPQLLRLTKEFRAGMKAGGSFWGAMWEFGLSDPSKTPLQQIEQIKAERDKLIASNEAYASKYDMAPGTHDRQNYENTREEIKALDERIAKWEEYKKELEGKPEGNPEGKPEGRGRSNGNGGGGGGKTTPKKKAAAEADSYDDWYRKQEEKEAREALRALEKIEEEKRRIYDQTHAAKALAYEADILAIQALIGAEGQYGISLEDGNRLIAERGEEWNRSMGNAVVAVTQVETGLVSMQAVADRAVVALVDGFIDFAQQADQSFSDFTKNFLRNIARMIAEALVLKAIQDAAGGMSSSKTGWVASIGKAIVGSVGGGAPVPHAKGGVVGSPVTFAMPNGKTGLMGEAGPEGILPLTRINGRLGVDARGSGGGSTNYNVVVNVDASNTEDPQGVGNAVAEKVMRAIAKQEISSARRVGGQLNPI